MSIVAKCECGRSVNGYCQVNIPECFNYAYTAVSFPKAQKPVKLTTEEFETLLFEVYKRGYQESLKQGQLIDWTDYPLKGMFDSLMRELKLKT